MQEVELGNSQRELSGRKLGGPELQRESLGQRTLCLNERFSTVKKERRKRLKARHLICETKRKWAETLSKHVSKDVADG